MTLVLDASALLAFLHNERGADKVRLALNGAVVSTVNWAEVVQKSLQRGVDVAGMLDEFSDVGVVFVPFTTNQAEIAAHLWDATRSRGLSLADRACLAVATERNAPVLTADRFWTEVGLDVEVQLLR